MISLLGSLRKYKVLKLFQIFQPSRFFSSEYSKFGIDNTVSPKQDVILNFGIYLVENNIVKFSNYVC